MKIGKSNPGFGAGTVSQPGARPGQSPTSPRSWIPVTPAPPCEGETPLGQPAKPALSVVEGMPALRLTMAICVGFCGP